ncbi:MAG: TetR/AcrR family transcriptional regulator [Anaerolineaceae bacterium]|nr:TetR/AcrR family transcriptional regulator [Anaerolineaceae bacterium]
MPRYKDSQRENSRSSTRQQLINAAITEIAEKGFDNANINHISLAAGFAKGTIYNYFPSKDALMLALVEEIGGCHAACIANEVRQETDPAARLRRFFLAGFRYIEDHPAAAQFLLTALYSTHQEFREAMFSAYRPMFQVMGEDILTVGIAQGVFRPVDIQSTTTLLLTLYLGSGSQRDSNRKVYQNPETVADFAIQALIFRRHQ